MSQIQITNAISQGLRNLRNTSRQTTNLRSIRGFKFSSNRSSTQSRYEAIISVVGELSTRYQGLLRSDVVKAETLIENARNRDRDLARRMGGTV